MLERYPWLGWNEFDEMGIKDVEKLIIIMQTTNELNIKKTEINKFGNYIIKRTPI